MRLSTTCVVLGGLLSGCVLPPKSAGDDDPTTTTGASSGYVEPSSTATSSPPPDSATSLGQPESSESGSLYSCDDAYACAVDCLATAPDTIGCILDCEQMLTVGEALALLNLLECGLDVCIGAGQCDEDLGGPSGTGSSGGMSSSGTDGSGATEGSSTTAGPEPSPECIACLRGVVDEPGSTVCEPLVVECT